MKAAISESLKVLDIEVAQITPTQKGERTRDVASLAQSIKAVGLMVPVIVRPLPDGSDKKSEKPLRYQLVDGHRRLAAVKVNKAQTIRAIEVDPLTTDDQVGMLQLTANLHRLQLTPFEEAEAIAKLRKAGRTPREIAADLGMTPQAIARRDQLNKLIPEWLKYIAGIREGHSLSVAAFEMIASYEASVQGKLLSDYQKSAYVPTVGDVKRRLAEFDRQLKSALANIFENEAIEKFLRRMKQKLSANQNRGPMIVNDSMRYINLLDRLEQNLRDLRENLFIPNPNWKATVNAASDVANFAAIIAVNAWRDDELNRLDYDTNVDRT